MKTIYIMDVLNMITPYQLVRCFKKFEKTYLIYTKGERTQENKNVYVKNYVVVKNNEDMWVAPTDEEWQDFQRFIKKIANESSLGAVTVVDDVHVEERMSIRVVTNRMFKVVPYYHHLLSQNYNDQQFNIHMENKNDVNALNQRFIHQFEIGTLDMPDIDYVEEYQRLKEENDRLQQALEQIEDVIRNISSRENS